MGGAARRPPVPHYVHCDGAPGRPARQGPLQVGALGSLDPGGAQSVAAGQGSTGPLVNSVASILNARF